MRIAFVWSHVTCILFFNRFCVVVLALWPFGVLSTSFQSHDETAATRHTEQISVCVWCVCVCVCARNCKLATESLTVVTTQPTDINISSDCVTRLTRVTRLVVSLSQWKLVGWWLQHGCTHLDSSHFSAAACSICSAVAHAMAVMR